jgi:hypothetical protein
VSGERDADGDDGTVVRPFEMGRGAETLTRLGNVFMRPLLRSRAGRGMREFALLSFSGRRSGRRYDVPVGYHELDVDGIVLTRSRWRVDFRGGSDIEVTQDGRRRPMRAELIEDPDEVADVYVALLQRYGIEKPTKIGLRISGDRIPNHEEIRAAVVAGRRTIIRLRPR